MNFLTFVIHEKSVLPFLYKRFSEEMNSPILFGIIELDRVITKNNSFK